MPKREPFLLLVGIAALIVSLGIVVAIIGTLRNEGRRLDSSGNSVLDVRIAPIEVDVDVGTPIPPEPTSSATTWDARQPQPAPSKTPMDYCEATAQARGSICRNPPHTPAPPTPFPACAESDANDVCRWETPVADDNE
jgi:hypothetical protein